MSEAEAALGVVVGHGAMAQGLVDAAQRVTGGIADCLAPLSNDGKNPEQLKSDLDCMVGTPGRLSSSPCGRVAAAWPLWRAAGTPCAEWSFPGSTCPCCSILCSIVGCRSSSWYRAC